jgi:predicted nucleotidyltransferase
MTSLASFLFTPKQQRLLATLVLNIERGFTFTELHEQAHGGNSSLQLYLRNLVQAGLIRVEKHRASKLYYFNVGHPLASEIKSIAIKSFALTEPIVEALRPFASKVSTAFIFGSIAKGTSRYDSDVDLMLVGDVSIGEVSLVMKNVESVIGRAIHLNIYDHI